MEEDIFVILSIGNKYLSCRGYSSLCNLGIFKNVDVCFGTIGHIVVFFMCFGPLMC